MKNFFRTLFFGLLLVLVACGHSQSPLPNSQDALPPSDSNSSVKPAVTTPIPVATVSVKENIAIAGRLSAGASYVSPLTSAWQTSFSNELAISSSELQELYHSSVFGKIFQLNKDEKVDWPDFLPVISIDRWFATRCTLCKVLKNKPLGLKRQFLTNDGSSLPADLGVGSRPASAYDPIGKNYVIVWSEGLQGGGSDIYAKLVADDGTTVRVDRKLISVARPTQGCLFANFASITGLTAPTDCKENVEPSIAYNDGHFLITWTKRGKAVKPDGGQFSGILGKMVLANNLEPISNGWQEGLLLSKITYSSSDPTQIARNDNEVQSWSLNAHSAVAPFFNSNAGRGSFLLVWDTTKDFVSCKDAARRTATSIYGRAVPPGFNPQGGNKDIFAIFTDPSTAEPECAPNSDVDSARKPRVAYLSSTNQFLTVFEVSKNVSSVVPSIAGVLVTLNSDLNQGVVSMFSFDTMDTQMHEGCFDPDVVATADRFLVVDNVGQERLKLTEMTINRGNIVPGNAQIYSSPDGLRTVRPRVTINRVMGQEGGDHAFPLEYVVASETRPSSGGDTTSQIQVVSFSQASTSMDLKLSLSASGVSTNVNPVLATAGEKVLVAWDGLKNGESHIFDSVVVVNSVPVINQKPVAVINVENHPEDPVVLNSGDTVTLSGVGSNDPEDGTNLTYHWQQTAGPTGTVANPTAIQTSFTTPRVGSAQTLTMELVATDSQSLPSNSASKQFLVNSLQPFPNHPPVTKITRTGGDGTPITTLTVDESVKDPVINSVTGNASWPRTQIALSGASSNDGETPPGSITRFHWEQTGATPETAIQMVSDPNQAGFSFMVPDVSLAQGSIALTIRLTIDDGGNINNTATQNLSITVNYVNHRPTAPVLIAPTNSTTFPPSRVLLVWEMSQDPDVATDGDRLLYDVYLDVNDPPTTPAPGCIGIRDLRCIISNLSPSINYHWRVAVRDSSNEVLPSLSSASNLLVTDNSVMARWTFDDGPDGLCSGEPVSQTGKKVCDQSGNGWHLVTYSGSEGLMPMWLQNGDTFLGQSMQNILGRAMGFEGNDYAINSFSVSNVSQASIEFWMMPLSWMSGKKQFLFYFIESDAGGITNNHIMRFLTQLDETTGLIVFTLNASNDPNNNLVLTSTVPLSLSQWNHVVCSFGPSGRTIYVNGVLASPSATDTLVLSSFRAQGVVGWNVFGGGYYLGVFDEIVVYNQELPQSLISNLAHSH